MKHTKKICISFILFLFLIILFLPNFVFADDSSNDKAGSWSILVPTT